MKLQVKLTAIIGGMLVVILAGVSVLTLTRSVSLQTAAAYESMMYLSGLHANEIKAKMDKAIDAAESLSYILNGYAEVDPSMRRYIYGNALKSVLASTKEFAGIYTLWGANGLDNMDAQYINAEGSDGTGRFMPFYIKAPDGKIEVIPFSSVHPEEMGADYKISGELISDPIDTMLLGNPYYISRLIVPIIPDGTTTAVGVVGVYFDLTTLQDDIEAINPYVTGRASLYANNGVVVASYDKSKIKQNFEAAFGESLGQVCVDKVKSSLQTGESEHTLYKGRIFVDYPFYVGDTRTAWTCIISIEEAIALKPVRDFEKFVIPLSLFIAILAIGIIYFILRPTLRRIERVAAILRDISEGEGDLTTRIKIVNDKDEIGQLAIYFNSSLDKIKNLVVIIKQQAAALFDIGNELSNNMVQTSASVNQITANIQSIKGRVMNQSASVTQTNATMEQVTGNIEKLAHLVEQQTDSVSKSSSAIEEMIANINSVTETVKKNVENLRELSDSGRLGKDAVAKAAGFVGDIQAKSESLLEINKLIADIASQTNLLSMNAAIEAAHAGESGKGFAVVADEIRKLAESSTQQSKTISTVLKEVTTTINALENAAGEVAKSFEIMSGHVSVVSEQEQTINAAMEEQNAGSQQILEVISSLNDITSQVKGGSEEMLEGSQQVIAESRNLEGATAEITNGMNEMAGGADQINTAVTRVNSISEDNKSNIDILVQEVSRFKVE